MSNNNAKLETTEDMSVESLVGSLLKKMDKPNKANSEKPASDASSDDVAPTPAPPTSNNDSDDSTDTIKERDNDNVVAEAAPDPDVTDNDIDVVDTNYDNDIHESLPVDTSNLMLDIDNTQLTLDDIDLDKYDLLVSDTGISVIEKGTAQSTVNARTINLKDLDNSNELFDLDSDSKDVDDADETLTTDASGLPRPKIVPKSLNIDKATPADSDELFTDSRVFTSLKQRAAQQIEIAQVVATTDKNNSSNSSSIDGKEVTDNTALKADSLKDAVEQLKDAIESSLIDKTQKLSDFVDSQMPDVTDASQEASESQADNQEADTLETTEIETDVTEANDLETSNSETDKNESNNTEDDLEKNVPEANDSEIDNEETIVEAVETNDAEIETSDAGTTEADVIDEDTNSPEVILETSEKPQETVAEDTTVIKEDDEDNSVEEEITVADVEVADNTDAEYDNLLHAALAANQDLTTDERMTLVEQQLQAFQLQIQQVNQQSNILHDLSSKMMLNMRKLQQRSDDDFSVTYEQISQLQNGLLATRRAANELSNLHDSATQAWENDLYTAEMRPKVNK